MKTPRSPESIVNELTQCINSRRDARALLECLGNIEPFADPHRLALEQLWVAQWRRCANGALKLRPALRSRLPDRCDQCGAGSEALVPIVYGLPGEWLEAADERGYVSHRGCLRGFDSPSWRCGTCGAEQRREPASPMNQRRHRGWREFAHLPEELIDRCASDWSSTPPLKFRHFLPWSYPSSLIRMIDRISWCATNEEFQALIPEIIAYDEELLFLLSSDLWLESRGLPLHNAESAGRLLNSCIELLRSIWWMTLRTEGVASPWAREFASREQVLGVRLRDQVAGEWECLMQLIEDAVQSTERGRHYVAAQSTFYWRQERDHDYRIEAQKPEWSESLLRLQDNADRLARNRVHNELTNQRTSVKWEALGRLIDDALETGALARLRTASLAVTIYQERWWEWLSDSGVLFSNSWWEATE